MLPMMLKLLAPLMFVAGHGASAAATTTTADAQVCTAPGGCDAGDASNLMQMLQHAAKIRAHSGPEATASEARPELHFIFQNNCSYPVHFFWDMNIAGSPSVLVLYNQKFLGTEVVDVAKAPSFGGRIYVGHADDGNGGVTPTAVPLANLSDVMGLIGKGDMATVRSRYGANLIPGEPTASSTTGDAPPGQLVEFSVKHEQKDSIYDLDISNVFYWGEALDVDMLYEDGFDAIDRMNCKNTSNPVAPNETGCIAAGGLWIRYPAVGQGPKGQCKSPNLYCMHNTTPEVCNKFNDALKPLYAFLTARKAELPYSPQLPDISDTTRMYTCDGMNNDPHFELAGMCASINRGQCDMPTADDLASIANFKSWSGTYCGHQQFYAANMSVFFKKAVFNPWAKYLRQTLGFSSYTFSLDEGKFGGNYQCRDGVPRMNWTAPTGIRLTSCPGGDFQVKPMPCPHALRRPQTSSAAEV